MKKRGKIVMITLIAIWAVGALAIINQCQKELRVQEKINYELQAEYNRVLSENAYQADKIRNLEQENVELQDKIERVLTLSGSTIDSIQRTNMSETRGGNLADAMGVTQTILDRSQNWNKIAPEVITQPGQYAGQYQGTVNDTVKLAFELVYLDGYRVFNEPTTHFATYAPYWSSGKELRGKLGGHYYWG